MEREKLREEVIPAYHEFRDKAVNQTLTLLYGEHAEARAVAKGVLADLFDMGMSEQKRAASVDRKAIEPLDVILFCPQCKAQHIDKAEPDVCEDCGHPEAAHMKTGCWIGGKCECKVFKAWLNPPHKKHRCHECNHVWKPAAIRTNGVETIGEGE